MTYENDQKILNRLEEQRRISKKNLKGIASGAIRQSAGNEKLKMREKTDKAKKYLKNSAKAINAIKQTGDLATAFTAIDFSKDAPWLIVILFSIIADLFTLIPIFGSAFAFIFSVFFWVYYAISGHYKNRAVIKAAISGLTTVLETFGVGINVLPFFTASALLNYWLILAERKNKQTQE